MFIYKISPAALRKVLENDNTSSEALAQGVTAQEDDYTSSEAPAQATAQENGIVDTLLDFRTKIINKITTKIYLRTLIIIYSLYISLSFLIFYIFRRSFEI